MNRNTALWALAAVCGLVLAAGISWATSQLTSQHIGLSSEPISAGRSLAPVGAAVPAGTKSTRSSRTRSQTSAPTKAKPPSQPAGSTTTSAPGTTVTESPQPVTTVQTGSSGGTGNGASRDEERTSGSSRPSGGRDD